MERMDGASQDGGESQGYPVGVSQLALIDAYNAMFRLWSSVPEDRDVSRERLLRLARAALGAHRGLARAHLVFDTWPGAERTGRRGREGRVSWHYVAGSADDAILEHLRRHEERTAGTRVVVVTDDRELAGRSRQLGARTMGVRLFFREAPAPLGPSPRPIPLDGPVLGPRDFQLPEGEIDLLEPEDEDLT
jgi:predicted RNA-binding protein with PIN domain